MAGGSVSDPGTYLLDVMGTSLGRNHPVEVRQIASTEKCWDHTDITQGPRTKKLILEVPGNHIFEKPLCDLFYL